MPTYYCSFYGWGVFAFFIIAMIVLCFIAARRRGKRAFCCPPFQPWSSWGPTDESAKDILDRRYAAGDITQQEYEQKLRDIQGP